MLVSSTQFYSLYEVDIVACQCDGVSNKPPWAPGSDKTWGQGPFGPFTGGLDLRGSLQPAELNQEKLKKKETDRTFDPFLLRQGKPGMPQYFMIVLD